MKKLTMAAIAFVLLLSPVMMAVGDPYVKDDDLIETIFEGHVTDLETGDPIEDAHVYGFDEEYKEWRSVQTDEEGYYYFEFRQGGTFYLYAEHRDYYQEEKMETVEMNDQTTVNFVLEPKVFDTRVFGVVADIETGEPLPEVLVNLWESVEDEDGQVWMKVVAQTITGEDGSYSLDMYMGNFSLEARSEGYDRYWTDPFYIESGDEYEHNIDLVPWSQGVVGKAANEEGEPLEGMVVTLEAGYYRYTTETDENGEYEIYVPREGTFTLSAQEEGYRPFVTEVVIHEDTVEEVDIEMVESQLPSPILQLVYIILTMIGGL